MFSPFLHPSPVLGEGTGVRAKIKKLSPEFGARALAQSRGSTRSCPERNEGFRLCSGTSHGAGNGASRSPYFVGRMPCRPCGSGSRSRAVFCGACLRKLSIFCHLSLAACGPRTRPVSYTHLRAHETRH